MRHGFHEQLNDLQQSIIRMGQLTADAITGAVQSLAGQDVYLARQVIAADDEIDHLLIQIELASFKLLALQQPMARDLRFIGTGVKLVTDLERMADHATDIARITLKMAGEPLFRPLVDIPRMAELAQAMTREALIAYVEQDVPRAHAMIARDDEIDHLYKRIFDELMEIMQNNPDLVKQATHLLFVAMYLERIGDHATNLGEWTIYMVTGELAELNK